MVSYNQDNIVAIATPPGISALAIIRLSGKSLKKEFKLFTKKNPKNRFALFSKLYHPKNKKILDEVIITYFKSPKTYTGEDVIEISCHGGETIKKIILNAAIDVGFRLALPGEFSFRAFINGKINLKKK